MSKWSLHWDWSRNYLGLGVNVWWHRLHESRQIVGGIGLDLGPVELMILYNEHGLDIL